MAPSFTPLFSNGTQSSITKSSSSSVVLICLIFCGRSSTLSEGLFRFFDASLGSVTISRSSSEASCFPFEFPLTSSLGFSEALLSTFPLRINPSGSFSSSHSSYNIAHIFQISILDSSLKITVMYRLSWEKLACTSFLSVHHSMEKCLPAIWLKIAIYRNGNDNSITMVNFETYMWLDKINEWEWEASTCISHYEMCRQTSALKLNSQLLHLPSARD